MGTFKNLDKYLELWEIFNKELKKKDLSFQDFSVQWAKREGVDEEKFYEKIKKHRERQNNKRKVQEGSLSDIKSYIKFLNDDFKVFEVFEDEKFGNLFS